MMDEKTKKLQIIRNQSQNEHEMLMTDCRSKRSTETVGEKY